MSTEPQRTCSICGNEFFEGIEFCPVCMLRKGRTTDDLMLLICNFTPTPQHNYRVGVPRGGRPAVR